MKVYSEFVLALGILASVMTGFVWLAWRKRGQPGGTPMVIFHVALAVGAASYALDITSTTLSAQVLWRQIASVAQSVVAISWLYAALQYANFDRQRTRQLVGVLALEPFLLAVAFALPGVTAIEWPASGAYGSILHAAGASLTPIYVVHMGIILVAALAGTIVLIQLFVRSRHLYRTQSAAILVSALTPWTVGLSQQYFLDIPEDASILAWGVSGMALTFGLYTFKTLDPVPAARSTVVETMGDGTVVLDMDGTISDVNPVAEQLLAPDGGRLVGRNIHEVLDGIDIDGRYDDWQELSVEVDGERRYLDVQVTTFTDRFDAPVGTLLVLHDVTDRTRREQRLAQYKTIFDSVTEPVYVLDDEGRFLRYNEPFAELVGRDDRELVGEPFDTVLTSEQQIADGGVTELAEMTVTTSGGATVPCESDLAPIDLADGASGQVGIIRDISERREIQSELTAMTERFETLVEASPLAIIAHDTEGVVTVWNPAAESLFGWRADEVRGETLPVIPDENREELIERHREVQSGEHLTGYETELAREDGRLVPVSVSAAPIRGPDGSVVGTVSVIADISERKARQRRLKRQNERLDEFAGIVSHDLRNPLQVASGNLELARQTGDEEYFEATEDALDRMESLIEDTLTLAREGRDIGQTEPTQLASLVDSAWSTVRTGDARLAVGELPTVDCDPERLQELLENLFRNAVEHGIDSDEGALTVTVGAVGDGFYVEDDGSGIPTDERSEVFDSGYTTGSDGNGLGLAIVETIAEAHGWDVAIAESEAGGARFEFTGVDVS